VNKIRLVQLSCCTQDKIASIFIQTVGFPLLNRVILMKSLDLSQRYHLYHIYNENRRSRRSPEAAGSGDRSSDWSGAMSGKWRGAEVAGGESEKSCRCVPVTLDGPRSRPHMLNVGDAASGW